MFNYPDNGFKSRKATEARRALQSKTHRGGTGLARCSGEPGASACRFHPFPKSRTIIQPSWGHFFPAELATLHGVLAASSCWFVGFFFSFVLWAAFLPTNALYKNTKQWPGLISCINMCPYHGGWFQPTRLGLSFIRRWQHVRALQSKSEAKLPRVFQPLPGSFWEWRSEQRGTLAGLILLERYCRAL